MLIGTGAPSRNVHGGRSKRYSEINDPIRKWPDATAYYTIDPSLGRFL